MNIEIDGPFGEQNISTLHRMYSRDQYLRENHNVLIKRVKLADQRRDSPVNLLDEEIQMLVSQV
jgi:hypothetical protein